MATLGELTRQLTDLDRDDIDRLQRLIGEWGLLADLSFADLLLHVRDREGCWYVVAHVRPATGQTIYIQSLRQFRGQPQPAQLRVLAPGHSGVSVTLDKMNQWR